MHGQGPSTDAGAAAQPAQARRRSAAGGGTRRRPQPRAHRPGAGRHCRERCGAPAAAACGRSRPSPPGPRCCWTAAAARGGVAIARGSRRQPPRQRRSAAAGGRGLGRPIDRGMHPGTCTQHCRPSRCAAGPQRSPALTSTISTLTWPVPLSSHSPSSFSLYTLTRWVPSPAILQRGAAGRAAKRFPLELRAAWLCPEGCLPLLQHRSAPVLAGRRRTALDCCSGCALALPAVSGKGARRAGAERKERQAGAGA